MRAGSWKGWVRDARPCKGGTSTSCAAMCFSGVGNCLDTLDPLQNVSEAFATPPNP